MIKLTIEHEKNVKLKNFIKRDGKMDDERKCFKLVDSDNLSVVMTSNCDVEMSQSDVATERTKNVDSNTTPKTSNRKRRRRKRQIMLVQI